MQGKRWLNSDELGVPVYKVKVYLEIHKVLSSHPHIVVMVISSGLNSEAF